MSYSCYPASRVGIFCALAGSVWEEYSKTVHWKRDCLRWSSKGFGCTCWHRVDEGWIDIWGHLQPTSLIVQGIVWLWLSSHKQCHQWFDRLPDNSQLSTHSVLPLFSHWSQFELWQKAVDLLWCEHIWSLWVLTHSQSQYHTAHSCPCPIFAVSDFWLPN